MVIQLSKKSLSTHELLCCLAFMPKYNYVAMDSHGKESKGTLEVASQNEAIGRVKDMGLFPTRIVEIEKEKPEKKAKPSGKAPGKKGGINFSIKIPGLSGKVKA